MFFRALVRQTLRFALNPQLSPLSRHIYSRIFKQGTIYTANFASVARQHTPLYMRNIRAGPAASLRSTLSGRAINPLVYVRTKMSQCCKPASVGAPKACCPPPTASPHLSDTAVRETVMQYYGEELQTSEDLKTSACKTCIPPPKEIRDLLNEVPEEVTSKFYGCGTPLPLGIDGLRVLDLGSGSGRDCYVASRLVGETGFVTGASK
jgi:hypothetical protein